MKTTVLSIIAILSVSTQCYCQQTQHPNQSTLHWWGDTPEFLNQQATRTFQLIDQLLDENPPEIPEPKIRKLALVTLDHLLHDPANDGRTALSDFFQKRIRTIAKQIKADRIEQGAMVYKLYNHSFIVKTPTTTLAFDLISNQTSKIEGIRLPVPLVNELVDVCDVLFVSHPHGDHADTLVARRFLDAGKPVIAAPGMWEDLSEAILFPPRAVDNPQSIELKNGRTIRVRALPGHQGKEIINNVYAVTTPEGLTFAHTGDQSNNEDFKWIDQIYQSVAIDVFLVNCWTNHLVRAINGVKPKLVVTGHENEMDHSIDHREPYWLTYERLKDNTFPSVVMGWGERYHYR